MSVDPAVQWALRGALALVLGGAAWGKWRDPARFRAAVGDYRMLPTACVSAAARVLTLAELASAAALLFAPAAAWAALALLALYTVAIALNLARGRRHIDCGCGGPAARRGLSLGLVARNGALMVGAWLCAWPAAPRVWTGIDSVTAVAGAAVIACLYAALDGGVAVGERWPAPGRGKEAAWSTH